MGVPLWVSVLVAALTGVAAVAAVLAGMWADSIRGGKRRRRCPGCWYDMAGVPGLMCPECGSEAAVERALFQPRRRWRLVLCGVVLFLLGAVPAGSIVAHQGWNAAPTTVLILIQDLKGWPMPGPGSSGSELVSRINTGTVTVDQRERIFVAAAERLLSTRPEWPSGEPVRLVRGRDAESWMLAVGVDSVVVRPLIDSGPDHGWVVDESADATVLKLSLYAAQEARPLVTFPPATPGTREVRYSVEAVVTSTRAWRVTMVPAPGSPGRSVVSVGPSGLSQQPELPSADGSVPVRAVAGPEDAVTRVDDPSNGARIAGSFGMVRLLPRSGIVRLEMADLASWQAAGRPTIAVRVSIRCGDEEVAWAEGCLAPVEKTAAATTFMTGPPGSSVLIPAPGLPARSADRLGANLDLRGDLARLSSRQPGDDTWTLTITGDADAAAREPRAVRWLKFEVMKTIEGWLADPGGEEP